MKKLLRTGTFALTSLMPALAFAHPGGNHVDGLFAGFEHPLFGIDHLLAMVAVGVIAARVGGRGVLLVPLSFVLAMIAGALLGIAGTGLPSLESGIVLSLVVFGATMALARPLPLAALATLAGLFALFHGNAHGLEIPETATGIGYGAGFVLGTSMLHAIGVLSAFKLARRPSIVRLAGVTTSLVGLGLATQVI